MSDITLLDGSIGQELMKRTADRPTPLWSTQVMMDRPDLVGAVHRDYVCAGATVLSTNTYAVHRSRLERVGLEDQLGTLIAAAVDAATSARAPETRVAGCIGPLLASYRPDLEADETVAAERFGEIADLMGDRVDIILLETVSSLKEARGALAGVLGKGKPVWIAFTVDDFDGTRLRSGEELAGILDLLGDVDAVLINCSRPEVIADAMPILARSGKPYGAYANGFTHITEAFKDDAPTVDVLEARTDLSPAAYADFVTNWVDLGATIVGGCCEVGPAHIAEIAERLRSGGHKIV